MIKGSDPKSIYIVQSAIQNIILNSYTGREVSRYRHISTTDMVFCINAVSAGICGTCPFKNKLIKTFFIKESIFVTGYSCSSLMNYRKRSTDKYLAPSCTCEVINRIVLFLLNDPSIEVVSNIRKKKNADKK